MNVRAQLLDADAYASVLPSAAQREQIVARIRDSLALIASTLADYGRDGVAFSFNGGKDSVVLLHLLRAVLFDASTSAARCDTSTAEQSDLSGVLSFYIDSNDNFPEMNAFFDRMCVRYAVRIVRVQARIREGLARIVAEHPSIRAVLLGTRRTDPYSSHLQPQQMTDAGWAPLMRVFPVLDWSYADVWAFLRAHGFEFCELYERGYTSLGSVQTTVPNPHLRRADAADAPSGAAAAFRPAWELEDGSLERAGRVSARPAS